MNQSYKKPRIDIGDLRTWINFYEYQPNPGPEPGERVKKQIYGCFAKVDEVYFRDLEEAKANGTLSDLTFTIRDTNGEYIPSNQHHIEVEAPEYSGRHYNIKEVQPDLQNRQFTKIIAGVNS